VAIDILPTPRRAARGSIIVWNVTLTPRNGTVFDVNISNPIPNTLSTPAIIRPPAGGSCRFVQANGQSVLQCSFASIAGPVVVQYSTRANVADTITNVVEAKYKACRNSPAVITIRNNNIVVIWVSCWLGLHAQLQHNCNGMMQHCTACHFPESSSMCDQQ
jgi:hypothetical protein